VRHLQRETVVKIIAFLLCLLVLSFIYFLNPAFFSELWHILANGEMEETIAYISSFGIWAMLFSFLLDILVNALGFLPSIFISTANGVLFGVVVGVLVSWLAETVGVILSFILMRSVLRSTAERLIAKSKYLKKLDEFSGKNGFMVMLVVRTLPYFPSGVITALGAMSKISLKDYMLSNLIGKFPSTALEVVIGYEIVTRQKNPMNFAAIAILAILIYGGIWWYKKREKSMEITK
jgi:uncharacterized membrane protein YdjX (TVP38/TMEM64 family)